MGVLVGEEHQQGQERTPTRAKQRGDQLQQGYQKQQGSAVCEWLRGVLIGEEHQQG